jgi:hypothetical protein
MGTGQAYPRTVGDEKVGSAGPKFFVELRLAQRHLPLTLLAAFEKTCTLRSFVSKP